jgi:hypothetical protein
MNEQPTPDNGLAYFDNPENWITKEEHRYQARQIWYPLAHVVTEFEPEVHQLMLRDSLRMCQFKTAICQVMEDIVRRRAAVEFKGTIRIIDVGAGYGILSYWAAKAFQATVDKIGLGDGLQLRIYAIEGNAVASHEAYRRLAAEGLAFQGANDGLARNLCSVLVCPTTSYEIDSYLIQNYRVASSFDPGVIESGNTGNHTLRLRADLILAAVFGSIIDNEDAVGILSNIVSRYLLPTGHVVPESATTLLAPIRADEDDQVFSQVSNKGTTLRFGCSKQPLENQNPFDFCYDAVIPKVDHLAEAKELISWQFGPEAKNQQSWDTNYQKHLTFDIQDQGRLIGLKGFSRMVLTSVGGPPIMLDLSGDDIQAHLTSDYLKHLYMPIEHSVQVRNGNSLAVIFGRSAEYVGPNVTYSWQLQIHDTPEGKNQQRYRISRPFLPPMRGHFDSVLEGLCHYVETIAEGTLLPNSDEDAEEMVRNALESLLGETTAGALFFARFFLAVPSSKDERERQYIWFSIDPANPGKVQAIRDDLLGRLPSKGIICQYQVNPNEENILTLDLVTYTDIRKELANQHHILQRILQSDSLFDNRLGTNVAGLKPGYVSLVVVPEEQIFYAEAFQAQNLRAFIYLLQGRLLVQLLLNYYQQRGMADTGYTVAHEIGQVTQFLHISPPERKRSGIVWPWSQAEELLDNQSTDPLNNRRYRSILTPESLVCLFPLSYQAAVNYIDLVADSKSAHTPFSGWHSKPLRKAMEEATAFAIQSEFAHWMTNSGSLQGEIVTSSVVDDLRSSELRFKEGISRSGKIELFLNADADFLCLPARDDEMLRSAGHLNLEGVDGSRVTIWISKMLAAAIMNTLKHTVPRGKEPWLQMHPIAVICDHQRKHQKLSIAVANRFRRKHVSLLRSEEGGTRTVLRVFQDRLRAVGARVDSSVKAVEIEDQTWSAEISNKITQHLQVRADEMVAITSIVFKGDCVNLFYQKGQHGFNHHS